MKKIQRHMTNKSFQYLMFVFLFVPLFIAAWNSETLVHRTEPLELEVYTAQDIYYIRGKLITSESGGHWTFQSMRHMQDWFAETTANEVPTTGLYENSYMLRDTVTPDGWVIYNDYKYAGGFVVTTIPGLYRFTNENEK